MAGRARLSPVGSPTRGTTNPNRLRRVDRWLTGDHAVRRALRTADDPLAVDLGYGASPVTTVELAARLATVRADVRVLGLELDADRVAAARPAADPPRLDFARGGFELAGTRPVLVRAFNVLRQYTEDEVADAWATMLGRLAPGGVLVEGTCDELGRRCCWITLDSDGPRTFTLACRPGDLERPSDLAERLPKALIHRNVPGEPVYALFTALDRCWATAAPLTPFGPRARWVETVRLLAERGWPVLDTHRRRRLGELTLAWRAVASSSSASVPARRTARGS
ncbi:class I SAM-dependent methyltransferase [Actinophytocola gossypii]|uniref:Class I SAM-dependent methyltransferase n=1 Tax=Actinophytocola gossypii TaxID=2812003 RepID=A0ABT2JDA5_9PSEU|nr:class I SAM-dependent methyltransferase [Actinophytocola gossypii]MCT2585701.1 class I SAM-dependent methyltransferase [Actinophytocola gossypii]